jgi:ferredoxin/flavodoxin
MKKKMINNNLKMSELQTWSNGGKTMKGLYFSGTGNTKYCVEQFLNCFGDNNPAVSIEAENLKDAFVEDDMIVFAYPVYFSNIPKIVRDFIVEHKHDFAGKNIFVIATMGIFSGDGTGCAARLLKKYGAKIIGGLHIIMPDCVGDMKLLKFTPEKNKQIIKKAEDRIKFSAKRLKEGNPTKEGLNIFYHLAGLFVQRLWFYGKTASYKDKPDIDLQKCIGCGLCIKNCPMNNLEKTNEKIIFKKRCTICYRCVNHCPTGALTILGSKVYAQCTMENYLR